MATLTALTVSSTTVRPGGGTIQVTATIDNPDETATLTGSLDGSTLTESLSIHEPVVFSADVAQIGQKGVCVLTVDKGGTVTVDPAGAAWTFTSA